MVMESVMARSKNLEKALFCWTSQIDGILKMLVSSLNGSIGKSDLFMGLNLQHALSNIGTKSQKEIIF